jgi:hypothetical protein
MPKSKSQPPRKLGKPGMSLWRSVTAEYAIDDASGREMLCAACAALDRAEQFAEQISKDGVTVVANTGVKEHPLVKHELANRAFVVRTLDKLGLNFEPIKAPGRPAGSWNFGR